MLHSFMFNGAKNIPVRSNNKFDLTESGRAFDMFSNQFALPSFETNLDGEIVYANSYFYELLGYNEVTKQSAGSILDVIIDEFKDVYYHIIFETVRYKTPSCSNYLVYTGANNILPVFIHTSPVIENNELIGIRGVILSNPIGAPAGPVHQTERKYRTFLNHSNEAVFLLAGEVLKLANDSFEKLFGYTENELRRRAFDYKNIIAPEYHSKFREEVSLMLNGNKKCSTINIEAITRDGLRFAIELKMTKILLNGENAVQGIAYKIPELNKNTENFNWLKSVYNNSDLGMFKFNNKLEPEMINPALFKMLGVKNDPKAAFTSPVIKQFINKIKTTLVTISHKNEINFSIHRGDGLIIHLKVLIMNENNELESDNYISGIVEDVTRRKQASSNFLSAIKRAEAAEEVKSNFLALISHEIRTPIHTILGCTSLLKDHIAHALPNDLRKAFDYINQAGKRLTRTIDLMLLMSDLNSGIYELSPEKIDLHEDVLQNLYAGFVIKSKEKGLSFNYVKNCRTAEVKTDLKCVSGIIDSIVDNAVKFTESGSIIIKLNEKDNCFEIKVEDTGIGINEKYLRSIYSPFSQEESGYSRKYEGNGLGLAVVKKLADLNNISVQIETIKNSGTIFTLRISK